MEQGWKRERVNQGKVGTLKQRERVSEDKMGTLRVMSQCDMTQPHM